SPASHETVTNRDVPGSIVMVFDRATITALTVGVGVAAPLLVPPQASSVQATAITSGIPGITLCSARTNFPMAPLSVCQLIVLGVSCKSLCCAYQMRLRTCRLARPEFLWIEDLDRYFAGVPRCLYVQVVL